MHESSSTAKKERRVESARRGERRGGRGGGQQNISTGIVVGHSRHPSVSAACGQLGRFDKGKGMAVRRHQRACRRDLQHRRGEPGHKRSHPVLRIVAGRARRRVEEAAEPARKGCETRVSLAQPRLVLLHACDRQLPVTLLEQPVEHGFDAAPRLPVLHLVHPLLVDRLEHTDEHGRLHRAALPPGRRRRDREEGRNQEPGERRPHHQRCLRDRRRPARHRQTRQGVRLLDRTTQHAEGLHAVVADVHAPRVLVVHPRVVPLLRHTRHGAEQAVGGVGTAGRTPDRDDAVLTYAVDAAPGVLHHNVQVVEQAVVRLRVHVDVPLRVANEQGPDDHRRHVALAVSLLRLRHRVLQRVHHADVGAPHHRRRLDAHARRSRRGRGAARSSHHGNSLRARVLHRRLRRRLLARGRRTRPRHGRGRVAGHGAHPASDGDGERVAGKVVGLERLVAGHDALVVPRRVLRGQFAVILAGAPHGLHHVVRDVLHELLHVAENILHRRLHTVWVLQVVQLLQRVEVEDSDRLRHLSRKRRGAVQLLHLPLLLVPVPERAADEHADDGTDGARRHRHADDHPAVVRGLLLVRHREARRVIRLPHHDRRIVCIAVVRRRHTRERRVVDDRQRRALASPDGHRHQVEGGWAAHPLEGEPCVRPALAQTHAAAPLLLCRRRNVGCGVHGDFGDGGTWLADEESQRVVAPREGVAELLAVPDVRSVGRVAPACEARGHPTLLEASAEAAPEGVRHGVRCVHQQLYLEKLCLLEGELHLHVPGGRGLIGHVPLWVLHGTVARVGADVHPRFVRLRVPEHRRHEHDVVALKVRQVLVRVDELRGRGES
eukprot:Rhum_TRINITY_DN2277_c0_g1::Rhum_TRINITY_DN2277_c0_g1_i1::g.6619::m.6619